MGNYMEDYDDSDAFPSDIFNSFVGGEYDFYGVDNGVFCIGAGAAKIAFEAVENPDDGYRSYFGCFKNTAVDNIFFQAPIARVVLEDITLSQEGNDDEFTGWQLRDVENGHVWLRVGTSYVDNYYPCFVFRYAPDESRTVELED